MSLRVAQSNSLLWWQEAYLYKKGQADPLTLPLNPRLPAHTYTNLFKVDFTLCASLTRLVKVDNTGSQGLPLHYTLDYSFLPLHL